MDQVCWPHGDTWSNEFTAADGKELTETEWEQYLKWCKLAHTGKVIEGELDEFVYVELDVPGPGGKKTVAYPLDVYEEERT